MTELKNILLAREKRQQLRQSLGQGKYITLSLNLNVPGSPKNNAIYNQFFDHCLQELKFWLQANRITLDKTKQCSLNHAAGNFFLTALSHSIKDVQRIKIISENFEENHPLGRFIDVDVADSNGHLIGSGKSKVCFFCGNHPAMECIHSKRHTVRELRMFQQLKIQTYLETERHSKMSKQVSSMALRAILYELSLSPKPGLVGPEENGVHQDMNYRMFIDSTAVISGYFVDLFIAGTNCQDREIASSLPSIRQMGLKMEHEMFTQTKGINTQKGTIFLMGISLFCTGYILSNTCTFKVDLFRKTTMLLCQDLVKSEFQLQNTVPTHGEICHQKYGFGGIRQEAQDGFPTVFKLGIPVLEEFKNTDEITLKKTLLSLMSGLNDTNILFRSNKEILSKLQQKCALASNNFSEEGYSKIIHFCKKHQVSPGGSADLLSISIFIYLLKSNSPL